MPAPRVDSATVFPKFLQRHAMLCWAALIGLAGAFTTVAFRDSLVALQWLILGHPSSYVAMAQALSPLARVALPTLGGLIAGILLLAAQRSARQTHPADYMEAIASGTGALSVRQTLLRSLSSLCTIGSGGSIGREGAMVQMAATAASAIGRGQRFAPLKLRLLVACGAAAGISGAYNAPLASAFFVCEIVLGSIVMETFGPILIAAVVTNLIMRSLPGYHPLYEMPAFAPVPNREVVLFVLLGVLSGALAPQFLRGIAYARAGFRKIPAPLPVVMGLGGLAVGLISLWVPAVWGNGYSVVSSLLKTQWAPQAIMVVLLCKIIATSMTVGSGATGGIFTPTLFVGAAVGALFGAALHQFLPQVATVESAFAVVGMGAFLAATSGAPLMAILMIFEMTASYQIVMPLMLACTMAYFAARTAAGSTMYEITMKRRVNESARMRLRETVMADLVKPTDTVVQPTASPHQMRELFNHHPVKYLYVVDNAGLFEGVVALQDLSNLGTEHDRDPLCCAQSMLRKNFLDFVTPDMPLADAMQIFVRHQGERLPVVASRAHPVFMGVVWKTSLLEAYFELGRSDAA